MKKLLRIWLPACFCIASARASEGLPSYIARTWEIRDGLPHNSVSSVIQTRDGYIWLGTRSGLARFDGARFTIFDSGNTSQIHSPYVTCLYEDAKAALWIGFESGDLACFESGKFRAESLPANWRRQKVFRIFADRAEDLWLLGGDGALCRMKDRLVISPPAERNGLLAMAGNSRQGIWVRRGNEVAVLEAGRLQPIQFDSPPANRYIQGITPCKEGGLWVMTEGRMMQWKDGAWKRDLGAAPWDYAVVHVLLETKEGPLVAGTADHGMYIIAAETGASSQFCRSNGFSDDWITSLCEDREGNLWAGTGNAGSAMFRIGNLTTVAPPDHWQGRAVLSVTAGPDGAMWVGTEGAALYRYQNGIWSNFKTEEGLFNYYIWSVATDAQGRAWAGTWGGGLFCQDGARFSIPAGLTNLTMPVPALLASSNGALFAGTSAGLIRYENGKVTWLAREPEVFSPDVRAIAQGADGAIWFGMSGGGLGCLKDGKLRQLRRSDGLSSDFVQCLRVEPNGTLWVGTFAGLNRFKEGRFAVLTRNEGLPNNIICDLEEDDLGNYWISTHGGLSRISKAELNRCADGPTRELGCLTYGTSDGLPALQCSGGLQPAGCKTADGRLWFPTSKGLAVVNPREVRTNTLPPPVILERLLVDDAVLAEGLALKSGLEIPPGRHRYEFQFTALSFAAPEKVRFKYRLAPWEREWVEAQVPRKAYYSYIPPGAYRFAVRACNNDGLWNDEGAALEFRVLPAFWQTTWFRAAGAILIALTGGLVARLDARRRMRRKLERLQREQAIERERSRIARDIHDDLGAGLTRISLLSESVSQDELPSNPASEALGRIFTTTHELTQAMDEIVWAVNPQHDTLDSLAVYLGKFGQDFLESLGTRCRLDLPMQLPDWRLDAEVRHNVFLAYKESLNNVARHAGATEVRVSLSTAADSFTLVVEDNGKGFELDEAKTSVSVRVPAGNGLANMRQRLAQIGGECQILSAPGRGTRVEFRVGAKLERN